MENIRQLWDDFDWQDWAPMAGAGLLVLLAGIWLWWLAMVLAVAVLAGWSGWLLYHKLQEDQEIDEAMALKAMRWRAVAMAIILLLSVGRVFGYLQNATPTLPAGDTSVLSQRAQDITLAALADQPGQAYIALITPAWEPRMDYPRGYRTGVEEALQGRKLGNIVLHVEQPPLRVLPTGTTLRAGESNFTPYALSDLPAMIAEHPHINMVLVFSPVTLPPQDAREQTLAGLTRSMVYLAGPDMPRDASQLLLARPGIQGLFLPGNNIPPFLFNQDVEPGDLVSRPVNAHWQMIVAAD